MCVKLKERRGNGDKAGVKEFFVFPAPRERSFVLKRCRLRYLGLKIIKGHGIRDLVNERTGDSNAASGDMFGTR
jgi:hypothetical protein